MKVLKAKIRGNLRQNLLERKQRKLKNFDKIENLETPEKSALVRWKTLKR